MDTEIEGPCKDWKAPNRLLKIFLAIRGSHQDYGRLISEHEGNFPHEGCPNLLRNRTAALNGAPSLSWREGPQPHTLWVRNLACENAILHGLGSRNQTTVRFRSRFFDQVLPELDATYKGWWFSFFEYNA